MNHLFRMACAACFVFGIGFLQSCVEDDLTVIAPTDELLDARSSNLTPVQALGKKIFFDKISSPNNMSCATCHAPDFGFTGPNTGINLKHGIYPGAVHQRFGNRKPPSAAYATFSPILYYDHDEEVFIGGMFWDGRATGETLGSPAAEQALGPFLAPVEHNAPNPAFVLEAIGNSNYAWMWEDVWGEPIAWDDEASIEENYDRVGLAISAYEDSEEVNAFTSKYDYYLEGEVALSPLEMQGLTLFNGKGKCNLCHPSEGEQPLFTDFTYDNLGVPRNPDNPWYQMNNVFLPNGEPINPEGMLWIDKGLGGFLESLPMGHPWRALANDNMGKHKVPTLRNVDKRRGPGNVKAYLHNGLFKSLDEVVHFYNTRDAGSWPPAEIPENVNTDELGNLGLTPAEEKAIVAFMKTLSDGYVPKPD